MADIVEIWIPIDVFKREYPEHVSSYYVKINEMIMMYQIMDPTNPKRNSLHFSLEDAWNDTKKISD